jgi:hypothetical protein
MFVNRFRGNGLLFRGIFLFIPRFSAIIQRFFLFIPWIWTFIPRVSFILRDSLNYFTNSGSICIDFTESRVDYNGVYDLLAG